MFAIGRISCRGYLSGPGLGGEGLLDQDNGEQKVADIIVAGLLLLYAHLRVKASCPGSKESY